MFPVSHCAACFRVPFVHRSLPQVLQLAEDLELTCDVRLAAGKDWGSLRVPTVELPQNEAAAMASNTADQWQAGQFKMKL